MNSIKLIKQYYFNLLFLNFLEFNNKSREIKKSNERPDILSEGIKEREELSNEKLQTITNKEFLSINQYNRLQYITKDNNKSEKLKSNDSLSFNFTYNGSFNKELWSKTTAGQVLPLNVRLLNFGGEEYKRSGLKGEFFNISNSRLIINQDTKIEILEVLDKKSLEKLINENEKKYIEVSNTPKYKDNLDIVKEAVYRNIDIDFAILLCSEKVNGLSIDSKERQVILEDLFTEFDRIKGRLDLSKGELYKDNKYQDDFVLKLFKKVFPDSFEKKSLDYGIKSEKIEEFKLRKNTPDYLSEDQQKKIIANAPENVKELVKKYFPPEECDNALLVCYGESSFKKDAVNINSDKYHSIDRGLFQINNHYHSEKYAGKNIFDPEVNIEVASRVFREAGNTWKPWYAAKKIGLA